MHETFLGTSDAHSKPWGCDTAGGLERTLMALWARLKHGVYDVQISVWCWKRRELRNCTSPTRAQLHLVRCMSACSTCRSVFSSRMWNVEQLYFSQI